MLLKLLTVAFLLLYSFDFSCDYAFIGAKLFDGSPFCCFFVKSRVAVPGETEICSETRFIAGPTASYCKLTTAGTSGLLTSTTSFIFGSTKYSGCNNLLN